MKTKVSGMSVPDEVVDRMKNAADPKKEGVKLCVETIDRLRSIPGVHGCTSWPSGGRTSCRPWSGNAASPPGHKSAPEVPSRPLRRHVRHPDQGRGIPYDEA
jgi:hypothetical protein